MFLTRLKNSYKLRAPLSFPKLWFLYLRKNPKRIKYFYKWILSYRTNAIIQEIPFWGFETIEWLENYLTKQMIVFEWGSGGSTIFISKRVKKIISVEPLSRIYNIILPKLKPEDEYLLEDSIENGTKKINDFPDNYFDLIIIDGRNRPQCAIYAKNKIKPGGWILYDDTYADEYKEAGTIIFKDWKRKEFAGLKAHLRFWTQTTIYQKPNLE